MKRLIVLLPLLAALAPAKTNTNSFILPVDNTLVLAGEDVDFTGNVHVVTKLSPTDPCAPTDPCKLSIRVNIQGASGVGQMTGQIYHLVGSIQIEETIEDLPASFTASVVGFDVIVPPNPTAPVDPCRVDLDIIIDEDGNVSVTAANLGVGEPG